MSAENNVISRAQFYSLKRVFLQQTGADKSKRHLHTRDKYCEFVRRSRFRWARRPIPDKGVIQWELWVTARNTGKKLRGVELSIPLGKAIEMGWGAVAQLLRDTKKELKWKTPEK